MTSQLPDSPPPCECPVAGYCARHKRQASASAVLMCQSNAKYRAILDKRAAKPCPKHGTKPPIQASARRVARTKAEPQKLKDKDIAELFPGEDPTLLGNRIAAMTAAIGIPACGGCTARKNWLNQAHAWLRGETV